MTRRLAEVAKKVGVSEATVSRVLNDKPGVSDATRAAVLTALDVLGYERPTQLRGERARLVGLVLPELGNPIFPALAEVVGGALAQRGFTPVLCTLTPGGLSEADYVEMLLQQQASGVIFAGGLYAEADAPHDHYHRLQDVRLPVVLVNAASEKLSFPQASTDDAVAAEQAFAHLLSLGHERIGMVLGPEDHVPSNRKLAAARAAAERAGVDLPGAWVRRSMFSLEGGQAVTGRLIRDGVTGVICASDPLALGVIRAVRRLGMAVPDDVSVVGYDDSAFMNCVNPPLTTVRQPIESIGRAAVTLLVSQVEGGPVAAEELLYEPELVVRASTARVRTAHA
ncbi:LacI family DNA-binding transcriptional regulator [Actinomadura nitritigenes]|uniref:LacI family DNA-binding transcriptional regulator n=1 Tax=Actinomadura nitritigenes TaxID=134602 RepID=A0ABS3R8A9_9ACTN|nr:LacI family DNA-binding transcriptional regulator [Actinomadura nitritigenes]MBO2442454.1 LacI family DNA-binding transcriptional regulator [Actinomadura nitritigenes]